MDIRLKFLGGAKTVTGSKYLLEIDGFKLLVDCGLFQGLKELRLRNWEDFPTNIGDIDAVVLTHAHLDHSGYLPKLVKAGYRGPVYCTGGTEDLLKILLMDAAKLQEEEALYAFKKGYSQHNPPQPLYDAFDAKRTLTLLDSAGFDESFQIHEKVSIRFINAGHILGAASVEITVKGDQQEKILVFSGDIGRYNDPILHNPGVIKKADILFIESTYGSRTIGRALEAPFAQIINEAMLRGGCLLIPAFAVGRTQNLLFYLHKMMESGQVPKVPVYIDSPMAIEATDIYRNNDLYHKLSIKDETIFGYSQFHYCTEQVQSRQINELKNNAIIISASGMCTGGRIMHHLFHRLPKQEDTLLFAGFQAKGTRGESIQSGEKEVKIFGQWVPVKCHVETLNGLSAHADCEELMTWLTGIIDPPKKTFVVHGEVESAEALAERIKERFGNNVFVPEYLESFVLFEGI